MERATTDVIPTAATVENNQGANFSSQSRFALLVQGLLKLGCERWEYVSEEPLFFSLYLHWVF
jgi:hypothetical protein